MHYHKVEKIKTELERKIHYDENYEQSQKIASLNTSQFKKSAEFNNNQLLDGNEETKNTDLGSIKKTEVSKTTQMTPNISHKIRQVAKMNSNFKTPNIVSVTSENTTSCNKNFSSSNGIPKIPGWDRILNDRNALSDTKRV